MAIWYANFSDPNHPAPPSGLSCTSTAYGICNVTECQASDAASLPAMLKRPQAGTLSVNAGDAGLAETLVPDANGIYASKSTMRPSLSGGELLEFGATGGDVPAFHETVENPLVFLLSEPAIPLGGGLSVSRSQDLKLVWTRGIADGTFLVQASSSNVNGAAVGLNCSVTADVGSMTIPSAALGRVAAPTNLQVFTVRNHAFKAGAYGVTIRVVTEVAIPDKSRAIDIMLE